MIMSFKQIHDEVTRLVNAITQGGGGGGGSTVSVISKRNTGENIADITVNNTTTQLYAPDSASDVSFDPSVKGVYTGTNTQSVVDEITDDIISLNDTITQTITGTTNVTGVTWSQCGKIVIVHVNGTNTNGANVTITGLPTPANNGLVGAAMMYGSKVVGVLDNFNGFNINVNNSQGGFASLTYIAE